MGYGDDLLVTISSKFKKKFPNRQIVIGNFAKNKLIILLFMITILIFQIVEFL